MGADIVHTSLQKRAVRTAELALGEMDLRWLPVRRSWRLNERHYGDLPGPNKAVRPAVRRRAVHGVAAQLRRAPAAAPPGDERSARHDPRYAHLPPPRHPRHRVPERRRRPHAPLVGGRHRGRPAGRTVLVAAHGNSLRALVKHLDGIPDADIADLNIPTGQPYVYELDDDMRPVGGTGRYLDPEAAAAAAEAVKNQGD